MTSLLLQRSPAERRRTPPRTRVLDEIGVLPPVLAALLSTERNAGEERWAAFIERYTPLLLHTVRRFARSYDETMDRYTHLLEQLSRDDFRRLRAFAALGPGRFTTWLVVVAHRLLVDYHRQLYGRPRSPPDERGRAAAASLRRRQLAVLLCDEIQILDFGDSSSDSETMTCAAECTAALQRAVTSLDPRDRLLLNLRFEKALAAREIAGVMGFASQGHVYRRLRAVLLHLRGMLPHGYREYVGTMP
jgi:RNA polymerase sigma factor (sigma-70 family)